MKATVSTLACLTASCSLFGYETPVPGLDATFPDGAVLDASELVEAGEPDARALDASNDELDAAVTDATSLDASDARIVDSALPDSGAIAVSCSNPTVCDFACMPNSPSCTFGCAETENCHAHCADKSTCTFACTDSELCDYDCPPMASCLFRCSNAEECRVHCANDSVCVTECIESDCTNITCDGLANCTLRCDDESDCEFAKCDQGVLSASGTLYCRTN